MKNKLLLYLLFFAFLGTSGIAQTSGESRSSSELNSRLPSTLKSNKTKAIIPPPLTTAGSACKEENIASVRVFMAASGGSGDIIEWFDSQTSSTVLFTGAIFSPSISQTTTYYVWSHSGADYSIRVPVVGSVFVAPPTVTLTASPTDSVICEGIPVTFTANGGADLFEFSVNGVVTQSMSVKRTFVTTTLKKGETVSVRTRYQVIFDGVLTEKAFGIGVMEDNVLSAPLSASAADGYINAIKISPTEKEVVFGMAGKLKENSSFILFLDTKPGGFNSSDYGDVASSSPSIKGFNFFNDNPSKFDSYFFADYCLVISTDIGGSSFISDIIELKAGNSILTNIGNTASPGPVPNFSATNSNTGTNDYNLGFEVAVLRSSIAYTQGDIKFFAFTMKDNIVTNSFLSPELTSSSDYGSVSVDYNFKEPNPVVVSADALKGCYNQASLSINLVERPTVATVGANQSNCTFNSSSLGGNTPTIGSGTWSLKSGPGKVSFSDATSGTSTATVDAEGIYIFSWTISNGVCSPSVADIKVEFGLPPASPRSSNQAVCAATPIQKLTATAIVGSGESVKWYTASTGGSIVTDPSLTTIGTVTFYAEAVNNALLCVSAARTPVTLTINSNPIKPVSAGNQTACALSPIQTLTASATVVSGQSIVWYDAAIAGNVVANPSFSSLGTVTFYAQSVDNSTGCFSTSRTAVSLTINSISVGPVSGGNKTECALSPIQTLTATATVPSGETVVWYSAATGGSVIASPTLNTIGTVTYYSQSSNGICASLSRTAVTLTIVGVVPNPTASDQTVCSDGTTTQTLTATATGNTITWYTAAAGGSIVANPTQIGVGTKTYYAESSVGSCLSVSRTKVVLNITAVPLMPTIGNIVQPTCARSTGTITITAQSGVEYSIGSGFQNSPIFSDLAAGSYTISVRFKNNTSCEIKGATQTINNIPAAIQFEVVGDCLNRDYVLTASPLANSYDPNNVSYQWKDSSGSTVGTNSNILNVSDVIASTSMEEVFPLSYTLTVVSTATGCEATKAITVETIYCNVQKGISPDGNGSNDYFDLRVMNVRKLEVFNRYGIKVYEQSNYTDQWKGQSDKGENLPSATYYYVMELNKGETKTGWIYLIREK